jgi:hypothetical protein
MTCIGSPAVSVAGGTLGTEAGLAAQWDAAAAHLSPAGQLQVATAQDLLAAVEARMDPLRCQLLRTARRLVGAKAPRGPADRAADLVGCRAL